MHPFVYLLFALASSTAASQHTDQNSNSEITGTWDPWRGSRTKIKIHAGNTVKTLTLDKKDRVIEAKKTSNKQPVEYSTTEIQQDIKTSRSEQKNRELARKERKEKRNQRK